MTKTYNLATDSTSQIVLYHVSLVENEGQLPTLEFEAMVIDQFDVNKIYSFTTDSFKAFIRFPESLEGLTQCLHWNESGDRKIRAGVLKIEYFEDDYVRSMMAPVRKIKSNKERLAMRKQKDAETEDV